MKPSFFYMCTDDSALDHLQQEISVEGLNLHHPRPQIQNEALDALVKPENTGDSHIRMLLKYPDMYGIDGEIVKMFLRSFYKILWDQKNPLSNKLLV